MVVVLIKIYLSMNNDELEEEKHTRNVQPPIIIRIIVSGFLHT